MKADLARDLGQSAAWTASADGYPYRWDDSLRSAVQGCGPAAGAGAERLKGAAARHSERSGVSATAKAMRKHRFRRMFRGMKKAETEESNRNQTITDLAVSCHAHISRRRSGPRTNP